jgi:hypothetical protein
MADDTSPERPPDLDEAATPNRDRRPDAPVVIEGESAEPVGSAEPVASAEPPGFVEVPEPSAAPNDATIIEPPRGGGRPFLSAAIGAIVGAAVAGAGLWFIEHRTASDPELVARLENLERNPPAPPPTAALAALDKRVGALEAALGDASDKGSAAAYGQRIAALESAALSAKAAADGNKDALVMAQAARDDAAKALALSTTAAQRVEGIAGAAPPAVQADADVGGLEARVVKLETAQATLDRPPVDLGPIDQRLANLENALAAPKTENRVAAESAAPGRDVAGLAVVAQALGERLRVGAPFPLEETALERLGADPASLAILKPLAEKGAPTVSALAADFTKIAPTITSAAAPQSSGGVWDRLMVNMSKAVRVTPVGEVLGDDPAALVSQVNGALARGDVGSAIAAWTRLPEPARQASQEWADRAKSRLAADKAAQGILDDAMTRLAAAGH